MIRPSSSMSLIRSGLGSRSNVRRCIPPLYTGHRTTVVRGAEIAANASLSDPSQLSAYPRPFRSDQSTHRFLHHRPVRFPIKVHPDGGNVFARGLIGRDIDHQSRSRLGHHDFDRDNVWIRHRTPSPTRHRVGHVARVSIQSVHPRPLRRDQLVPTHHHKDHSGTNHHPTGSTEHATNPLLTIHAKSPTSIRSTTPQNKSPLVLTHGRNPAIVTPSNKT